MATARLRKTFRYPEDDSADDDTDRGLDEEEQENLIGRLRKEDKERNDLYKRIFLTITLVSAAAFLPSLVASQIFQARLVSVLCILTLLTSAYILAYVPPTKSAPSRLSSTPLLEGNRSIGPLESYIEYANGGLSLVLGANAYVFKDRHGVLEYFWLLCLLPALCFSILMLARRLMISVDIGELEKLKYRYKGA